MAVKPERDVCICVCMSQGLETTLKSQLGDHAGGPHSGRHVGQVTVLLLLRVSI